MRKSLLILGLRALPPCQPGLAETGAEADDAQNTHWAFIPPSRPELPVVNNTYWPRGGIDRFILDRLEQEGLQPSAEAERGTLIRRLSLDLTGLPPSLDEIDAFVADQAPDAYERVVDRLLQSPHYGPRMAQAWLDWSRYADSGGKNYDLPKTRWPWRDWVIRAFNANIPFDRFTIEQLAGDLLPNATLEQRLATGFNRNAVTDTDGFNSELDVEQNRVEMVADMVNTTAQVWLALSMGCAQCHDHKHDPLSQQDYYALFAFFNRQPAVRNRVKDVYDNYPPAVVWPYFNGADEQETSAMVMKDAEPDRQCYVLQRGDFLRKQYAVEPDVPGCLRTPLPLGQARSRLELARWLFDRRHPLTSRVLANRLWELVFGAGLVKTSEDFGTLGELPSHPQLLDWLAVELVERDWNIKAVLRLMVTSATYRQSSAAQPAEHDQQARLLGRYPRGRLSAECIRDSALALGGLLNQRVAGPPVYPVLPAGDVELYNQARGEVVVPPYATSTGPELFRRSIYLLYKRSLLYPPFALFDAPTREVSQIRRAQTNTPLQALALQNEPTFLSAARGLAQRALAQEGTCTDRLRFAFRLCTGRAPSSREMEVLGSYQQERLDCYRSDPGGAHDLVAAIAGPFPSATDEPALAAWIMVASLLLNLDETISKD